MTDLDITRLCAEAMQLHHIVTPDKYVKGDSYVLLQDEGEWGIGPYDPLHDDAQAMALVKAFPGQTLRAMTIELEREPSARNFNRAICECVAKLQATG